METIEKNRQKQNICIGLVAHVDAGKTTLSEALLYQSGQIRSLGRVDHQDAYLDTDAQERERGITIFSKQAVISMEDMDITLLDTPGHVDFSAEMERTLQVLDYAVLVISGTDGVQGHTRTLWRLLRHYQIPVFLFINKMYLPGADCRKIDEQLKKELSDGCIDFSAEKDCNFYEMVAMCQEQLFTEYMDTDSISTESIQRAIVERCIFPCFYGSALKLEGVAELLDALALYAKMPEYGSEFAARVFKIGRDDRGTRLTYLKLTGGRLRCRERINETEKVDQIRRYSGTKYENLEEASAGQVVAVTGLSSTVPGQGLGREDKLCVPVLEPVLTYQMLLPAEVNPAEFMKQMRLLEEEDPELGVVWKEEVKEIHVQLMGPIQMEVLARQVKERFGIVVRFGAGSIVYKETIAEPVEGVGHFEPLRHYAEVHLLLAPGETGSGITVDSVCSEDVLDKNWQRLITTHIEEREHRGGLTGSGLTDVKITILTGRAHPKHTEGGDFRQATYRAIRQGLKRTKSILLEPYYRFALTVPMEHVGRALTDLQQRFAKVESPEFYHDGSRDMARICGKAPVATLQDYITVVHAYTQGLGSLTPELAGYDVCHNTEDVLEQRQYDSELDYRNPTASVFCAHGAGFVVPWDEVEQYMHLPYVFHGDVSREALKSSGLLAQDGCFYDYEGQTFSGREGRKAVNWEKTVASMSEQELDAELADVYAREFGISREEMEEQQRKKWSRKRTDGETIDGVKPSHVKYDKKGNPIYPNKGPVEEYLIVDGYNIIFAWEDLKDLSRQNIDAARDSLKDILCNYQGYRRCRLILVFDAYKVRGNAGKKENYQGIEVVFTRQDETADAYIERLVHEIHDKYRVTVATSDGLVQQTVLSLGALRMSAAELKNQIDQTCREGYEEYLRRQKI